MKKSILLVCLVLISSNVFAQSSTDRCNGVRITQITAGPLFSTLVRMNDTSCAVEGWVCVVPRGESRLDEMVSDRVFSMALTARANGERVNVVWDDEPAEACGRFPQVRDFRLLTPS